MALPVIFVLAWLIRRTKFPAVDYLKILSLTILMFTLLFWFFLYGPFIRVIRYRTYSMTWSIGDSSQQYPGETHVILTFVDYPNHFEGIYSSEVGDYLLKSGKNPIDVVFQVTTDYGKMRGYTEMKIGDLVLYRDARQPLETKTGDIFLRRSPVWGYAGRSGKDSPSPWSQ